MKLMQVWFANPMWVDEVLSIQNGTSGVMGARSPQALHVVLLQGWIVVGENFISKYSSTFAASAQITYF